MTFRDHFSRQASTYAAYRPHYPEALFDHLAALVPRHELAWDCATGSGQAALGLAPHFTRVIATDASAAQIAHATPHPRVEYRVAPAEASGLEAASVDLVTVAQALHWFDVDAFYAEVRRVLAPGGALAVSVYGDVELDDPELDYTVRDFNHGTVGRYWPPERALVDTSYTTLPFPFARVATPTFTLEQRWTLAELAGYLRSWSATTRYIAAHGHDPLPDLERMLAASWGDPERRRRVRWPFTLLVGVADERRKLQPQRRRG
jgi:SAM-dependent methyltransferase